MVNLLVPAVLLLLGATVGGVPDMPSISDLMELEGNRELRSVGDLNKYLDKLLDLSNLHMAKSFATETRRYRRELDLKSVRVNETVSVELTFADPARTASDTFEKMKRMLVISTVDTDYILFTYGQEHVVFRVSSTDFQLEAISSFSTTKELSNMGHVTGIKSGGKLWFAFGCETSSLVTTVSVDLATNVASTPQVILRKGAIGGLHLFEANAQVFLAIGMKEARSANGETLTASAYKLDNNYFDFQDGLQFTATNVTSITGFAFRGDYYIVFGMRNSDGSQVYKFDTMLESMTLIQQLPDTNVKSVLHFLEVQETKHYVLVNDGSSQKIYRWAGERLLLWQDIDQANLASPIGEISSFPVSMMETVLLLGNGGRVTFFADDVSAVFQPNHNMVTNCNTIGDLSIVRMGGSHVLFYICEEALGDRTVEFKKVIMEEIDLEAPPPTNEVLFGCLTEVKNDLEARKNDISFLEDSVANDIIMTTDKSLDWFAEVTFLNGLTVNGTSNIHEVNITGSSVTANSMTFPALLDLTASVEASTEGIGASLGGLLYHNGEQTITSPQAATVVTADIFESDASKIEELNSMKLLDMDSTFMLDGFDQNIGSSMTFHTITTDSFSTRGANVGTINGVQTSQFMRKDQGSQTVTGFHNYAGITANSISGPSEEWLTLNSINTTSIVTSGSSRTLDGRKTFKNLNVQQSVNISLLNEVDLSSLAQDLVFKNLFSTQVLDGTYSFDTLTVVGDADAQLINLVDMKLLDARAVKKNQNFNVLGNVVYQNLTLTNLESPLLNDISWSNIVSDETTTISGHYHFTNATVTTAVLSDSVNGLDISQDVVTTNTDQDLKGKLTFAEMVVTGSQGLLLSDASTINGIKPDDLVNVDSEGNLDVVSPVSFNNSITITGSLFGNLINNLDMTGIEDRYWRKGISQEVEVSPTLQSATFGGSVSAGTVNGHQMTDFLSTEGFQTITGHYTFEDAVNVAGNINMQESMTINGIDVSALAQNAVRLNEVQEIAADTTFAGKVTISGDLTLNGRLNGWDVTSDFMRLDKTFLQTGNLTFTSKTIANTLTQSNSDLFVGSLNGLDVKTTTDDLVLYNEDATITGTLQVTGTANVGALNVGGTVDAINVGDLAERSLKKVSDTTQHVSGRLTVDNLVFNQSPSLDTVNSKDWSTHLSSVVLLDHNGPIAGTKTFTQSLNVVGNFNPNLINGAIDISALVPRILTKSTSQNLTARYTFSNDLTTDNVDASVIDTVNTDELLLIDEANSVSGTVSFASDVVMTNLFSNSGVLDGCDVVQVNTSAVWKDETGNLEISFPFTVDSLTVLQDATYSEMKAGTNQVDMQHFLGNIVTKSQPQDITGSVEFTNDVTINTLMAKSVDGVDMDTFYEVTVQDNEEIVIDCDLQFSQPLTCQNLSITTSITGRSGGKVVINGLNVSDINENAVLATGGTYTITGSKTFSNGLSTTELGVNGLLGTVPVSDLAVLSDHINIASDLVFKAPVTVEGNVQVDGLLDGVNLPQFLMDRIKLDEDETMTSSTTFEDIRVEGNLVVDTINGIDFSEIVLNTGRAEQTISGHKSLAGGLTVNGEVEASVINGVTIADLQATVVRIDAPATITKEIVFENFVDASVPIAVTGNVNGFDLSELAYDASTLKENIEEQSGRLYSLNETLSGVYIDNNQLSCSMYATLDYGIEVAEDEIRFSGKLSLATWGSNKLLAVTDCTTSCICPPQTDLYNIAENGELTYSRTEGYGATLLEAEGYTGVAVLHTCNGTGETLLKVRTNSELETMIDTASVTDAATFTVVNDVGPNTTYLVTTGSLESAESSGTTFINVYNLQTMALVHSLETPYSAATVDVSYHKDTSAWAVLVATNMAANDTVDPYTARSQVYIWTAAEKLELYQEFYGQHVTSGLFLESKADEDETFVTLAQLKASKPNYAENLKYEKEVLVYRYDESFEPYQTLKSYGVVAQTSLYVAHDLFLILLSKSSGTLDVYTHRPNEGFQLLQQIAVCKEPVDLVKDGHNVYVSCFNPSKIIIVTFNDKGYYYAL